MYKPWHIRISFYPKISLGNISVSLSSGRSDRLLGFLDLRGKEWCFKLKETLTSLKNVTNTRVVISGLRVD